MDVGEIDDQLFFHNAKDQATQDRPPDRANPANDRHQQDGYARLESKNSSRAGAWINENSVTRMDGACNSGQSCGNGVDPQL